MEEITVKYPNGSTSLGGTEADIMGVDKEIIDKESDGSTSPGGTWEETVKNFRINSKSSTIV